MINLGEKLGSKAITVVIFVQLSERQKCVSIQSFISDLHYYLFFGEHIIVGVWFSLDLMMDLLLIVFHLISFLRFYSFLSFIHWMLSWAFIVFHFIYRFRKICRIDLFKNFFNNYFLLMASTLWWLHGQQSPFSRFYDILWSPWQLKCFPRAYRTSYGILDNQSAS